MADRVDPSESRIFRAINNLPNSWRGFFLVITQFGGVGAVVALMLWSLATGRQYFAFKVFVYAFITAIVALVVKVQISRPRPAGLLKNVHRRAAFTFVRHGFPSSHTANATILALLTLPLLPVHLRWLPILWIVLVGFSRIYLGAHMPADVVGGFIIGLLVYVFGFIIEKLALKA